MAEDTKKRPPVAGKMRVLTDEVLDGFELKDIQCRSCSGYGNCGYKSHYLKPDGGIASICMRFRKQKQCERDGIPFNLDML